MADSGGLISCRAGTFFLLLNFKSFFSCISVLHNWIWVLIKELNISWDWILHRIILSLISSLWTFLIGSLYKWVLSVTVTNELIKNLLVEILTVWDLVVNCDWLQLHVAWCFQIGNLKQQLLVTHIKLSWQHSKPTLIGFWHARALSLRLANL